MAPEIVIGEVVLASVCEECGGVGYIKSQWVSITGKHMPFIRNDKCKACFKSSGYVLTDSGYALCAFFELVLGK